MHFKRKKFLKCKKKQYFYTAGTASSSKADFLKKCNILWDFIGIFLKSFFFEKREKQWKEILIFCVKKHKKCGDFKIRNRSSDATFSRHSSSHSKKKFKFSLCWNFKSFNQIQTFFFQTTLRFDVLRLASRTSSCSSLAIKLHPTLSVRSSLGKNFYKKFFFRLRLKKIIFCTKKFSNHFMIENFYVTKIFL